MSQKTTALPAELRHLVRQTTTILGDIIREAEGKTLFNRVEFYRQKLKETRGRQGFDRLVKIYREVAKEPAGRRLLLAHAFALQLELVNCCEAAYRTWRIRQRPRPIDLKTKTEIIFVLTAHPTEARSPEVVRWLNRIIEILIESLDSAILTDDRELRALIRLLWQHPLAKSKVPSVLDEARYIFSLALSDKSLRFLLKRHPSYELHLCTWVGGDKDGHPLVNHRVMRECLQLSRQQILETLARSLSRLTADAETMASQGRVKRTSVTAIKGLQRKLRSLRRISAGDGNRVQAWQTAYQKALEKLEPVLRAHHENIAIEDLIRLFPAFVLPIDLREDASLIQEALVSRSAPIRLMLSELAKISGTMDITSYARELIISHCERTADLQAACDLIQLATKSGRLPAVPLFESREALLEGPKILRTWIKSKRNSDLVKRNWGGRFEVMLGYSDSAKQIGVLPSRYLLAKAMREFERTLKSLGVVPLFFHGSGGSVDRGGGSLREQVAWWTPAAVRKPKLTVQGEMIQRRFASKEILNSECSQLSGEVALQGPTRRGLSKSAAFERFVQLVEREYRALIGDSDTLGALLEATPYRYLNVLNIGSRPSRRHSDIVSLESLRAIPWVLCWTQTRLLMPTWWGIGSAWSELSREERREIKKLAQNDPFLSSFVKALGFTLAKVELGIWQIYFERQKRRPDLIKKVREEHRLTIQFLKDVTGQESLLWYRPWLQESIYMRSPHIHILNFLQILAMRDQDPDLMRETLVGIACGMLTTG